MPPPDLAVRCQPVADGWLCDVTIGPDDGATHHQVTVPDAILARLWPDATEPDGLVRASFAFLLQREPRESILRSFDLPVIGRYFPDWEAAIRRDGGG
jgi:hypothetical protein